MRFLSWIPIEKDWFEFLRAGVGVVLLAVLKIKGVIV